MKHILRDVNKKGSQRLHRLISIRVGYCLALVVSMLSTLLFPAMTGAQTTTGDVGSWQTASSTLAPGSATDGINRAAAVQYNGYAYSIGGTDSSGTSLDQVSYAKLSTDGSVGTWQSATPLPVATDLNSAVVYNGYIYEIGGNNGGTMVDHVYYAPIQADGSVGTWQNTSSLPVANGVSSSVVYNGYVYEIGGGNGGGALSSVFYAKINADGSLGTWQTAANSLPHAVYQATAVQSNGYVYLLGGFGRSSVYYAKLNTDGSVGVWQTAPDLDQVTGNPSAVTVNGYVYLLGGFDAQHFNTVAYARLNADGSVGAWQTSTNTLPGLLAAGAAVTYNGYIYYIDGSLPAGALSKNIYYTRAIFPATTTAANDSMIITTPTGTLQTCADAVTAASLGKTDGSFTYPLGLAHVCYYTYSPSDQINVVFVTNLSPSQVVARDYNAGNGTFINVPGAVITDTTYNGQHALQLSYSLTDNGPLDTNPTVGIVEDPVGLAENLSPDTGYGKPLGQNRMAPVIALLSLIILGAGLRAYHRPSRTDS